MRKLKPNTQQLRQLFLGLLVGMLLGTAISSTVHYILWRSVNVPTGALAAGDHGITVRVTLQGAGPSPGTHAAAMTATADKAHNHLQLHQLPQAWPDQQQIHPTPRLETQHVTAKHGQWHKFPSRLIVATGANEGYYRGLMNLVGSVHYWCADCPVVVFNLGLSEESKEAVNSWCNTTLKWRDGIQIKGIDSNHVTIAKQYAWKPFAILEAVQEHQSDAVLWLDAGSTVTGPLMTTVWPLIREDGHFLVQGQDNDMTRFCMQETFDYLKQKREDFINKPSYSGNTVRLVYGSEAYHKILLPWLRCAAVPQCIAPPGASTSNHRFDQVVLSIITYTAGMNVTEHTELLEVNRLPCFVPNTRVVWTSRTSESCYTNYTVCSEGYHEEQLPKDT